MIASGCLLSAICFLLSAVCFAVDAPVRLFFSDAKLSVLIPEPWDVSPTFPFGPLLTRKTKEGTDAFIDCQVSNLVEASRVSADVSTNTLKDFATRHLTTRTPPARVLAASARTLAGQNAYEVTWLSNDPTGPIQYQSVYFFMDNRFYVLSLRAQRDSFPWIVQDFQTWLTSVNLLHRQESGELQAPAHGGLWIHQTGGARITIPEDWLIGVADDRQVGATIARDKMHLSFSAVVNALPSGSQDMTPDEKEEARKSLVTKGYKIVDQSEEPFHGLAAYRLAYEGSIDGRFVRGQDLWVAASKARWLISVDGDSRLLRQLADEWQGILNDIHFYQP